MATNLIVRNVDDDVALALKQRAAAHGRSPEAEHLEIRRGHGLEVVIRNAHDFAVTEAVLLNPFV